jgi:hypothetical protein
MTETDITQFRYWLDLILKSIIGIVISLVGMDYRQVKNSLKELEQSKYSLTMQVEVMHVELNSIKARLERIEEKLDKALDR